MPKKKLPGEVFEIVKTIKNKRAKIVIDHIIKHGQITTEELEKQYGYTHPPRAARDVREAGIPLRTIRVKSSDGRSIAAYTLGDLTKIRKDRLYGRITFPKKFKSELYEKDEGKCAICSGYFESRYLQVDHKVPYEVAGDINSLERNAGDYMLLCSSCNRAKSWSCEHCENWLTEKSSEICLACYWGNPEDYSHIALREIRRLDLIWEDEDIKNYEKLKEIAKVKKYKVPNYVKKIIEKHLRNNSD